ncbi:MAG: hypothetical protein FWH01_06135 [Oscillospiraceae bacterium]|nr:hypothetical protein [Oscillospiraceae bacterium]
MKSSLIKGALLLRRNLVALGASFAILSFALPRLPAAPFMSPEAFAEMLTVYPYSAFMLSLVVYALFVVQSLSSREFKESVAQKETINKIRKANEANQLNARVLKRKLAPNTQQRLDNMMRESNEIVQSFLAGNKGHLKEQVVQQSLKLTTAYITLADMFRVRSSASNGERISQLAKRINSNMGIINSAKEQGIADELKRVVEADERMIESLKNERFELDKIDARLQYMESTIGMLKYNIISNLESEDILTHLESDVHEADVLNTVLNERYDERREERRVRL